MKVRAYARENLVTLSVEFIMENFHNIILPKMVKDKHAIGKSSESYDSKKKTILRVNGLTKVCLVPVLFVFLSILVQALRLLQGSSICFICAEAPRP